MLPILAKKFTAIPSYHAINVRRNFFIRTFRGRSDSKGHLIFAAVLGVISGYFIFHDLIENEYKNRPVITKPVENNTETKFQ